MDGSVNHRRAEKIVVRSKAYSRRKKRRLIVERSKSPKVERSKSPRVKKQFARLKQIATSFFLAMTVIEER
jgi:hypothetical protein